MAEAIFFSSLSIFLYMTAVFFLALAKQDNSIVDIAWGPGFILVGLVNLSLRPAFAARQMLVFSLIVIWGARLAVHIYLRNRERGEDYRYAQWRMSWGRWFVLRSYFQIFMLQGFLMLVVSFPAVLVSHSPGRGLGLLDLVGVSLWLLGFVFEAVGDYQMVIFRRNPQNKGRTIASGLWKYTRHPNYFGEAAMWWGIFLIAFSAPKGWAVVVSPLAITFLLLKVSGVAMIERKYRGNAEFEAYARKTNAFFPWFPKKADE
jgi:steroid 5-alpha reductase family enzyme